MKTKVTESQVKGSWRYISEFESIEDWQEAFMEDPEVGGLTPGLVADLIGVTRQRVRQMIQEGKLQAYMVRDKREGGQDAVLVPPSEVRKYLSKRKRK